MSGPPDDGWTLTMRATSQHSASAVQSCPGRAAWTDYSAYRVAGVPACGETAFLYFAEGKDALVAVGLKTTGLAPEQVPQHVQCMLKQFGQGRRIHHRKDASGQGAVFQQSDRYVIVDASSNAVAVYIEPGR